MGNVEDKQTVLLLIEDLEGDLEGERTKLKAIEEEYEWLCEHKHPRHVVDRMVHNMEVHIGQLEHEIEHLRRSIK